MAQVATDDPRYMRRTTAKTIGAASLLLILPAALAARSHKSGVRTAASSPLHPANKREWNNLRALAPNAMLEVIEEDGARLVGTLVRFSPSAIVVSEAGRNVTIRRPDVARVKVLGEVHRWLHALLIGGAAAGVGAAVGSKAAQLSNENKVAQGAAIGAGSLGLVGAGLGLLAPIRSQKTIFQARDFSNAPTATKSALFAGYTLTQNKFDQGPTCCGGPTFHLPGWDASIEHKPTPWLGLVFDASQQYGFRGGADLGFRENENQTFLLFGLQVSPPKSRRVMPFAHVLLGVVIGSGVGYVGLPPPSVTVIRTYALATGIGGGVDFKIAGPIWFRAIQADYIPSHLDADHKTQAQFSSGFVFRW